MTTGCDPDLEVSSLLNVGKSVSEPGINKATTGDRLYYETTVKSEYWLIYMILNK